VDQDQCQIKCLVACDEPQTCDMCLSAKHQVCPTGSSCCGCMGQGATGTCTSEQCGIRCMAMDPCMDEDLSNFVDIILKFGVTIACQDFRVNDFIQAVQTKAVILAGEWEGTIIASLNSCVDTTVEKRTNQFIALVQAELVFNGPYAGTVAQAIHNGMQNTTISLDGSAYGQYLEFYPNPPSLNDDNDEGLSGGAVAGIVIGSVAGATILVIAIFMAFHFSKREDMIRA